jgi:hypothetical protein
LVMVNVFFTQILHRPFFVFRQVHFGPAFRSGCLLIHAPNRRGAVTQTSQSAVSRVSKPAGPQTFQRLPIGKSAIQQVGKPAIRRGRQDAPTVRAPKIISQKQKERGGKPLARARIISPVQTAPRLRCASARQARTHIVPTSCWRCVSAAASL